MLSKVHKQENPGKTVIDSVNCRTSSVSQCVEHHLQPHVKELKFCVKDSNYFIILARSLKNTLVTMDVCSLYTNIPLMECIKTIETKLKRKDEPIR